MFLSHAGTQKQLVKVIKEGLERQYPALKGRVFLDEDSLEGGDRPMKVMYESLRDAFVGKQGAAACMHTSLHA